MLETSYVKLNNSIFKQNMQKMYKSEVKERMSNEVSPPPSQYDLRTRGSTPRRALNLRIVTGETAAGYRYVSLKTIERCMLVSFFRFEQSDGTQGQTGTIREHSCYH